MSKRYSVWDDEKYCAELIDRWRKYGTKGVSHVEAAVLSVIEKADNNTLERIRAGFPVLVGTFLQVGAHRTEVKK